MIATILIFIIVLGVLVFVHELGHFLVAKKSGMAVEEFGFGFPPRVLGLQRVNDKWKIVGVKSADPDHTVYSINWLPFGAFVRIRGENGDSNDTKSFTNSTWTKRFLTLVAGVGMNVVAAWVLVSVGLSLGLPTAVDENLPKNARVQDISVGLVDVAKDSPASAAGLRPGDEILSIQGQNISQPEELQQIVAANLGKSLDLQVRRGGNTRSVNVTPDANPPEGRGALGVQLAKLGQVSYPWYLAPWIGLKVTGMQLSAMLQGLWGLITAGVGVGDIAGPAKIAQITGQVAELGVGYLLQFAAFLSLNLAILNALPFPALDGGRVLFLIIEKIRGKKNNQHVEQWANALGFLVLILLVTVVTVNDIRGFGVVKRLFGG